MIGFIIGFAGFIVGIIIGALIANSKTIMGSLIIDDTDKNTDVYRIEINDLDIIPKKKRILLKVKNPRK